MGWLGWSVLSLGVLAAAIAALAWWATSTGSVETLDAVDGLFGRGRRVVQVDAGAYGSDPHQKVRLFAPAGKAPTTGFPLVAFYHGGGWRTGSPDAYTFVARALASRGYATALIGYRLGNAGKYPAMLQDSAAGLRWALDHAAGKRIDASRVALAGHSAGAYNAVMLALDPRWLTGAGVDPARLAGVAGLSGPYDFYPFRWPDSKRSFGEWANPAETQPVSFARGAAALLLLLTGTDDTTVRPRNTMALAKAIRAAGGAVEVVQIDGMGHSGPIITLARPFDRDARVGNAMFAFLTRVLPASSPVKPRRP